MKQTFQYSAIASLILIFSQCQEKKVDFSAEVKPILNKRCISCHGGVKKNGGFSVLFRDEALDTTESGHPAIIPGDPEKSEMIKRLTASDPELRMPYKEEPLTSEEIQILKQWVKEGAVWGDHWAYVAPMKQKVPHEAKQSGFSGNDEKWAQTDIDYFVLQKLNEQKLSTSPEANKATLIRRVYLDIIGLPPTLEQAQRFIDDPSPDAYEKVVDELLHSPRYGEKWASWWLDLARYADTKGYERDVTRNMWRYRDWVIKAFNDDKPFDTFTIEQLAGDLLQNPSDDQLIATAFHRNTMNNDEGGTEDEEFRVAALIDRVNTTWEVWQSTTMACVQCHSHPYDPFKHETYYQSMAFFNNTRDEDTEGENPNLRMYEAPDQKQIDEISNWVRLHSGEQKEKEVVHFLKTLEPKYHPHDFDQFVNGELIDTKWLGIRAGGSARLKNIRLDGKTNLIINYWVDHDAPAVFEIRKGNLKGDVVGKASLKKTKGRQAISIPLKSLSGKHDLYFVFPPNAKLKPGQAVCGIEWFAFRDNLSDNKYERKFIELLNAQVDNTPITLEANEDQKRETRIFERGNWLVKGELVKPAVPESLNPFPKEYPDNRLGFAKWIVSDENPLTSRVVVNRVWEQIFGAGIVETVEDFGTQGAQPTHPELLDYLALRLMHEHQWSMKKLVKDIVMSATYRQDSKVSAEALEKDPSNRYLSRGARVRLSAEQVRDQALAVSGLLSDKMFGKSVMPYQPDGIWQSVWNGEYWKESEGEDKYRRGVYTFIKRTSPYPSSIMFDGSSREVCVSRRIRTNTPLQALVTLNDPVYVSAARALAKKMASESKSVIEQISFGYKRITFRSPTKAKLEALNKLYTQALSEYKAEKEGAAKLTMEKHATAELAALTVVANALLNLDEVIMKE